MQSTSSRPAFDLDRLADNWGSKNAPLFRHIFSLFRGEALEMLPKIQDAVHQGDHAEVVRLAHLLRGASGNVCAMSLYESAGALENAAEMIPPPALQEMVEAIQADWRRLEDATN